MSLLQIPAQAFPNVSWLAIAPEIVLGVGAAVVLLVEVQWRPGARVLGWLAGALLAAAFGFSVWQWLRVDELVAQPGSAQVFAEILPFGRMLVMDRAAALARLVLIVVAGMGVAGGWRLFHALETRAAEALALVLLSTAGFSLMSASTHLVMIFLGLEVGSISLYVLAGITRDRYDADEAALKYFLLGSVSSAVFVYGAALVYAGTGQLNVLGSRVFLRDNVLVDPAVLLVALALLIVGMAFKVSAAPFHSWAPDVYQGAPAGIVGFMAAAAKVGGFAALVRILFTGFPGLLDEWAPVVAGISVASMVIGSVLAIVQDDVRRMLAYSSVSHAGFILTAFVAGAAGSYAVWFYLAVYALQVVGGFTVVSSLTGPAGSRASIASFAGLSRRSPFLALCFAVLLLGMAGLPLTSGFIAKFGVFQEAWLAGYEWLVVVGVLASVAAFFFYLRVIVVMYMQEPVDGLEADASLPARWVAGLAAAATVVLGLLPGPLLQLVRDAAPL